MSTPPSRWANRMGTYQAMDWADKATKEELDHVDGGASSIQFGAGLWGPRELRLGWHHQRFNNPTKHSPLKMRLNKAIMQEPGDIYCSNMAAVYHQVVHQYQTDGYQENRETWYVDGHPRKLAVMLRSNTFPGIARTTKPACTSSSMEHSVRGVGRDFRSSGNQTADAPRSLARTRPFRKVGGG